MSDWKVGDFGIAVDGTLMAYNIYKVNSVSGDDLSVESWHFYPGCECEFAKDGRRTISSSRIKKIDPVILKDSNLPPLLCEILEKALSGRPENEWLNEWM